MWKLFISNLSWNVTEDDLRELFSEYGTVVEAVIIADRKTGRSKGFGAVSFAEERAMRRALNDSDGMRLKGRDIYVKIYEERGKSGGFESRFGKPREPFHPIKTEEPSVPVEPVRALPPRFHNPYNFVPALPRPIEATFAGDYNPLDHGLVHDHPADTLWSGDIPVVMTVVTPLLLLKSTPEATLDGHKIYESRTDLPLSAVRGMLRNAYEIVTNSRFCGFTHKNPLLFRSATGEKLAYAKSPLECLPESLREPTSINQLSPADRLFGWVSPQKTTEPAAYKGRISLVMNRIEPPENDIEHIYRPAQDIPLATLSAPKPAQVLFYGASDQKLGKPLTGKATGYDGEAGIRGRKVYPHQSGLEWTNNRAYWTTIERNQKQVKIKGRYQEFRAPEGESAQTDQNRSIRSWVKPGTTYRFTLRITNLQDEEVGALLWLLTRSYSHYFKLGYGRPLGFGSVSLAIDWQQQQALPVAKGSQWSEFYASFAAPFPLAMNQTAMENVIQAFQASMMSAYPALAQSSEQAPAQPKPVAFKGTLLASKLSSLKTLTSGPQSSGAIEFTALPFIAGFLKSLTGFTDDLPVHYPRLTSEPDPKGEQFRWFMQNKKGKQIPLPYITEDEGLPYEP